MKKQFLLLAILLLSAGAASIAQNKQEYAYGVPQTSWQESLGNHRAVLQVQEAADVVLLEYAWRRADKDVDKRRFLIVNAATGDTVANIRRMVVNGEVCKLQFGPVRQAGTYYFYYLPYQVQLGGGFYSGGYLKPEPPADAQWVAKAEKTKKVPVAKVLKMEARTQFDSFYPMEMAATKKEADIYLKNNGRTAFYIFPEDRKNPIRMRRNIPAKWLDVKQGTAFIGTVAPNEYYAFQVGVWAAMQEVKQIAYEVTDLRCGTEVIPASAITCFNVEGVNPYGKAFKKEVNIAAGMVQSLWFGIDIPIQAKMGDYTGSLTIKDGNGNKRTVSLQVTVRGSAIADRGDSEPWKHSRLRWLNSTLGISDIPTEPYLSAGGIGLDGNVIECLGRRVTVSETTGLPAQITAGENDLLNSPIRFVIETAQGEKQLSAMPLVDESTKGHVRGRWKAEDSDLQVEAAAVMEFDGWLNYVYKITPKKDVEVKDIRLVIPMRNEMGRYFLGAGLPGQDTPQTYEGKWDAPEKTVNNFGVSIATNKKSNWLWPFDSFWIGDAHGGIHCELRGSNYTGPLLNSYRPAYPESWNNGGKGGFSIRKGGEATEVVTYSGERTLKAGQPITFDFALLVTPVKPLDLKAQFTDRYYHNGSKPVPTEADVKAGVRIINVHHANEYNPFINYPFLTVDKVKDFTKEWHQRGCKVKLYYTLRELTSATTELWAIRSLGTEILRDGNGGGFPWCREHMVDGYVPQWYQHFEHSDDTGIVADAALLTSESDSRWYNYYVEGLRWMVQNMDIDGIYLDDVSFGRDILKRMRRAMNSVKPGCIIDLHSNTGFSKGPANQYAEFFPYVDKLWFGESFLYDKMTPANYLVEASGIPFGLTADMLHRGGNRWLGMQYGMTVRHPWLTEGIICDPRVVWKIWDEFGIQDSEMIGFWEQDVPVTASDEKVKITVYKKKGCTLLSVGNYSDETKSVLLNIDWEKLGIHVEKASLSAPEIPTFQKAKTWGAKDEITIEPRKGWLIYINEN